MPFPPSRPALRLLGATLIGLACLGNAAAQTPTIADEITVATLTPQEKDRLLGDLFKDLNKDDDDQEAHVWDNGGDRGVMVKVTYNFSNSGMTEHSLKAHVCRDLKFIVTAGGKSQDLSRRTCSQNSGKWDVQGKDPAPVVYPPFLSDVTIARLNAQEQASLLKAAVRTLKDEEDGKSRQWSNKGLGNAVPLAVRLTPSGTDAKPGSYSRTCRDLTMVLDGKSGKQELTRRSCENRYGGLDIEPDYVDE
ncbi:hypothetical protein CSQ94_18625 [Janthinobacterium sp. BJB312]|uniref:hypothetical protein n=1 Tax=Janthinobacterium sp. RA13 TaxID=1502762 RepID=UPI00068AF323|nr:hypothetical protein [Janthinobacterium sp. RA13]PHV31864.1 hypothetical protein CSQ94_18625 [Janthinobacterium sp. BJB312]